MKVNFAAQIGSCSIASQVPALARDAAGTTCCSCFNKVAAVPARRDWPISTTGG
jgi:hypothetical protein